MERQFCINWPGLVEEAKQRRKAQKLTQAKLALLAGVSTPTISRFESGKTDIQLPTVLQIFRVLGMLDQRELIFPAPNARYHSIHRRIIFTGKDGEKTIFCAISEETLQDHFYAANKSLMQLFAMQRARIEHEARRKYLANSLERDGIVLVKTEDI
jgi:transcriptional regulator with XRE-family HTH domain